MLLFQIVQINCFVFIGLRLAIDRARMLQQDVFTILVIDFYFFVTILNLDLALSVDDADLHRLILAAEATNQLSVNLDLGLISRCAGDTADLNAAERSLLCLLLLERFVDLRKLLFEFFLGRRLDRSFFFFTVNGFSDLP